MKIDKLRKINTRFFFSFALLIALIFITGEKLQSKKIGEQQGAKEFSSPKIPFSPPHYVCYRVMTPIEIDGRLEEPSWLKAAWTEDFVDIEGDLKPKPRFRTRVKMLWDDRYFYVGAELEEPHVWATLIKRDSIIYHDNDFEVFIDPDGDTHEYYELEMNALGTEWDLFLVRPYRDGGPAVSSWDIQGLITKVLIDKTVNRPEDEDKGWSVEMAMPWEVLKECAPGKKPPQPSEQWRVNFSRVEYRVDIIDGKYLKARDEKIGKPLPEDNWVWAPQGLINIHYPEMWGFVQFSAKIVGSGEDFFELKAEESAKWALRQVYYRQKSYYLNHGQFTNNLSELGPGKTKVPGYKWPPQLKTSWNLWEACLESEDGKEKWFISQDGRLKKL